MHYYKEVILGSALALSLIGCGGAGTVSTGTDGAQTPMVQTGEAMETPVVSIASRMTDVGKGYSNQEAVDHDYATLKLPKYIISSLQLPTEGAAGSDINWSLLNMGDNFSLSISGDNTTLEVYSSRDKTEYAKLSAFINYDLNSSQEEANRTKEFCVTILPEAKTDKEKVEQDAKIVCGNDFPITIDLNSTDPYQNCGLPEKGANDSNITWISCNSDLLEINGTNLTVPDPSLITEKTSVKIKGVFQYGESNKTAIFTVYILPQKKILSNQEICDMIQAAADDLKKKFPGEIQMDSEGRYPVLPQSIGDVTIIWTSCDAQTLSIDEKGNMTNNNTSGNDKKVKIRAELKLQGHCKTLCFLVDVPSK